MAIIPCRECAHQVSDQAPYCPSCGAPVTRTAEIQSRRRRIVFRVLVTLMTLWTFGTGLWLLIPSGTSNQLISRAKSSVQRLQRGTGALPATGQTKATYRPQETRGNVTVDPSAHDPNTAGSGDLAQSSGQPNSAQLVTPGAATSTSVVPAPLAPVSRSIYRTTAQQLNQDFSANVVAIQTRIGNSRVRITGTVAEIDQDATGHPVVKLWAGQDSTAEMILTEDQRTAAAQLAKDEAVEIECDKMTHRGEVLEGSDCNLAVIDEMPRQVNLALFVANDNGTTGVYVVGPMSEAACLSHGDTLSSKLHVNQGGEYVVWKGCTNAARESIAPAGCRLNTSPTSVADIAPAHLWQYNCGSSHLTHASGRKRSTPSFHQTSAVTTASPDIEAEEEPATGNPSGRTGNQEPTGAPPFIVPLTVSNAVPATASEPAAAPASTPSTSASPSSAGTTSVSSGTSPAAPPASEGAAPSSAGKVAVGVGTAAAVGALAGGASAASTGGTGAVSGGAGAASSGGASALNAGGAGAAGTGAAPASGAAIQSNDIRLASASESDTGRADAGVHSPPEEATVAHAPQDHAQQTSNQVNSGNATSSGSSGTADDLSKVRSVDPQAADHISTYCSKTIVSGNRDSLMAECRHSEAEAWARLVLQNEFPTLDDATRRKCSEPPFPDTYVAKESCARYELHVN